MICRKNLDNLFTQPRFHDEFGLVLIELVLGGRMSGGEIVTIDRQVDDGLTRAGWVRLV